MHPAFPGLGNQSPYRCRFEIEDGATAALSQSKLDRIAKELDHQTAVEMAVDEIVAELQALADGGNRPDVAIVALPVRLLERVWNAKVDAGGTTEKDAHEGRRAVTSGRNPIMLRRILKPLESEHVVNARYRVGFLDPDEVTHLGAGSLERLQDALGFLVLEARGL